MADGSVGEVQEKAQEVGYATKAGEQVVGAARDLRSVGEELRRQGKEAPVAPSAAS
jgi:hypothetical protein